MSTKQLEQQARRRRRFPWRRFIIVIIVVFVIVVMTILGIYNPTAIFAIAALTALSLLISLLQWLFPVPVEISGNSLDVQQTKDEMIASGQPIPPNAPKIPEPVPSSIFFFNEPLPYIQEFYGRTSERNTVINRARRRASTSIIGPRRIGKTWLLEYTKILLSNEPDHTFLVGYLDASAPSCKTVSQFTNLALEALGASNVRARGLDRLESFVKDQKQKNLIPVLLIDEFEGLTNSPEFNLDFFSGLRSIANAGLVLVTTSREPLPNVVIKIAGEDARTSPFFNIFEQITLKPFHKSEAEEFAHTKSEQAKFTALERGVLLKYGTTGVEQWPPLRLQLTGKLLLESEQEPPGRYRPNDPHYWREFEHELEEKYRGAVR